MNEENWDDEIEFHKGLVSLGESIRKAIDYHIREYHLTYDAVIGCLEIMKLNEWKHLLDKENED